MATWVETGQKFDFFVQKSWFFCNSKQFSQNIMTSCYSYYFCIFYVFHFSQIIMVSLLLARHDQYFIMFKDLNVLEFANFLFKTKYNNTLVYSIITIQFNYLFSTGKQQQQQKIETIHWLNLLFVY